MREIGIQELLRGGLNVTRGLLLGALLLTTGSFLPAEEAEPLTPEDIVRLHVAGTSTEALIRMIRSQPEGFEDLPEELLTELRRAGLPEELIAAMQEPQDSRTRERADALDRRWSSGPALRVPLNPGQNKPKRRRIRISDRVDPFVAMEWRLGNAPEDRRFVDVAIFLACRSAKHVPDRWRGQSALRWDSPILSRQPFNARRGCLRKALNAPWATSVPLKSPCCLLTAEIPSI